MFFGPPAGCTTNCTSISPFENLRPRSEWKICRQRLSKPASGTTQGAFCRTKHESNSHIVNKLQSKFRGHPACLPSVRLREAGGTGRQDAKVEVEIPIALLLHHHLSSVSSSSVKPMEDRLLEDDLLRINLTCPVVIEVCSLYFYKINPFWLCR